MRTLKIKTFKMNATGSLPEHHFFILSKGYNAGKPLEKPCQNCFIVTAANLDEKWKLFWICYALWKSGSYFPLLCGSVIPFIRMNDVASVIERCIEKAAENPLAFDSGVQTLQILSRAERLLNLQLVLIQKIKSITSKKIVKRWLMCVS